MYTLFKVHKIEDVTKNKEGTGSFAEQDIRSILMEIDCSFPLAILYVMPGEDNTIADIQEVAESLSDYLIVAMTGSPEWYHTQQTDDFLNASMIEFCQSNFIPVNDKIGNYEFRETYIYNNPVGELVAFYISNKERTRDEHR